MTTLITTTDRSIRRCRRLLDALQAESHAFGSARIACLAETLECLDEAESVVVVHSEPAEPLMSFVDRTRELAADVPVLVWGAPQAGDIVVEYLLSGAKACFLDGDDPEQLLAALPAVRDGEHYLPPVVQRMLLNRFVEISSQAISGVQSPWHDPDGLTEREREVLELLVEGYTNPEIADRLFLEVGTVKNHVHHILTKLDVPDRQAAARYYETRQRFTAS
jgi:DNA-binding NarL/FixJ family response regulator